jgi:hypothetical protein
MMSLSWFISLLLPSLQVDFKPSGRRCCQPGCGGLLVDNILDWDTPLPEDELDAAVEQAEEAVRAWVVAFSYDIGLSGSWLSKTLA